MVHSFLTTIIKKKWQQPLEHIGMERDGTHEAEFKTGSSGLHMIRQGLSVTKRSQ